MHLLSQRPLIHEPNCFSGRRAESEALVKAIRDFEDYLRNKPLSKTRMNVVVFHGIGGIGKTTLSSRFEAWLHGELPEGNQWGDFPLTKIHLTARYDLHESTGNIDAGNLVLSIRKALNNIKTKWPAFDIAFATWWASSHPGESKLVFHDPGIAEIGESFLSTLSDFVADIFSGLKAGNIAAGLTSSVIRKAVQLYLEKEDRRLAEEIVPSQEWFRDLLLRVSYEPSPENPRLDLLLEIVKLLDFELAKREVDYNVVFFIDAFENIQNIRDWERRAECFVNELIWNLPRVLFVITGRNALTWARGRKGLCKYTGQDRWPTLTTGGSSVSHQYQVGSLSFEDSIDLIKTNCIGYDLPLSDHEIEQIAKRADGYPLHIDLILTEFQKDVASGAEYFSPEILEITFDELVARLLRDIPEDEQEVLRSAALFSSFDEDLLIAVSGKTAGCVLRALERSLVERHPVEIETFRMHDTIRQSIRLYDPLSVGGWAPKDWQHAAGKALEHFRKILSQALKEKDFKAALKALGNAITLVCAEEVYPTVIQGVEIQKDWLVERFIYGPSFVGLRPFVPTSSATAYGQLFLDFINARNPNVSVSENEKILRAISDSNHPLAEHAIRYLGESLRAQSRFEEALVQYDRLVSFNPCESNGYSRQLALIAAGCFDEALNDIRGDLTTNCHKIEMLKQRINFIHGIVAEHLVLSENRIDEFDSMGNLKSSKESRHTLLLNKILCETEIPIAIIKKEIEKAEDEGALMGISRSISLRVFNSPFEEDNENALEKILAIDAHRLNRMSIYTATALVGWAWVHGKHDVIAKIASEFKPVRYRTIGFTRIEFLLNHLGYEIQRNPARWLEPYDVVQSRWIAHWEGWRERVDAGRVSKW